jgi:hypothetical protein
MAATKKKPAAAQRKKAAPAKKKAAPAAKKKPAAAKQAAKKPAAPATAKKKPAPRKDLGAPIDAYLARQPSDKRMILDALRKTIRATVPDTTETIKWGVPFFMLGDKMVCAIAAFKQHVKLNLFAPPEVLGDPDGLLEGGSMNARSLNLRSAGDLHVSQVRAWVERAAAHARG